MRTLFEACVGFAGFLYLILICDAPVWGAIVGAWAVMAYMAAGRKPK